MARYAVFPVLFLLTASSAVGAETFRVPFPGLRTPAGAVRVPLVFEANEGLARARHRGTPTTCSGLAAATGPHAGIIDYEGGIADGIEDVYQVDIPGPDIVTIELDYADPTADLDLVLIEGGRIVAISNVEAAGGRERIVTPVNAGRYYVGVSAVAGSSAYTLKSSFSDVTSLVCEPVSELESPPRAPVIRHLGAIEANARRRGISRPVRPPSCTFNVSPLTQTVAKEAGILTINVTAEPGCDWRASSNTTSWMTLLWGGLAYGNGSAGFSIRANTGTSSRTGSLTVAGKTVSITQVGPCTYAVSPTSPMISSSGGTNSISVTTRADCAWTASVPTTATWITITSGQSGTGNGTVTYSVDPNSTTSSRTATLTVAGRSVTVKQALNTASCTYAVAYTSRTFTWCGGERSVNVTTQGECPWTASKDASWITLGGTDRSGTGALAYLLSRNSGASRQGTIMVAGTPVVITQSERSGGGTYDGVWKGTTASNRNVELCVADDAVQDALVTVRLSFPTFTCTGPLVLDQTTPITGSAFSSSFDFPGSNISTTVRGTFTSSTAMNGSHDGYSGSYFIFCGSTVAFGTGGSILSTGTYTASKQP